VHDRKHGRDLIPLLENSWQAGGPGKGVLSRLLFFSTSLLPKHNDASRLQVRLLRVGGA
jgi:hypothetical protein